MEILTSDKFLLHHSNLFFKSNFHKPPSLFPHFFLKKHPKKQSFCTISTSNSLNYGGWEDLKLIEDLNYTSKFDELQSFLVSIGINDKKHVFMFVLGFFSALAISRVRVSSILVFPASVLVFAFGFSLGFFRQGGVKELSRNGSNKKGFKDEKMRKLVELFSELDGKVVKLEKDMKIGLELDNVVQVGEFESYCNVVKNINLDILQAKNVVEALVNDITVECNGESVDHGQVERNLNQKSSRKKREVGASSSDIFQFIVGMFQENGSVAKPSKVKDIVKKETVEPLNFKGVNNPSGNDVLVGRNEEVKISEVNSKKGNTMMDFNNRAFSQDLAQTSVNGDRKAQVIQEMVNGNSSMKVNDLRTLSRDEVFSRHNYSSQFVNNNGNIMEIGRQNGKEMFINRDNLYDPLDPGVDRRSTEADMRSFTMESKALQQEEIVGASNGYHVHSYREKGEIGRYKFDVTERREVSDDAHNSDNQRTACDLEEDSASSSSVVSEDIMFNKHLTEATDLLKEARVCLKDEVDEDRAEVILYKSASLLSRATALKPMSLLAVGQLGNAFLLHGELKLRMSRELRTFLSRGDSLSRHKSRLALKSINEENMSRDRVASILVDVCEECEELLVEAGRRYRVALSIDGSDVRALYNWGLALSYRAQLIADVGPEAASDADRVYLAAIDKFNAMMSTNKAYAPDALFRWGVILQQRSRLRPSKPKEKMRLLHQAKSLLEDAVSMDTNNLQVREALSSCISEIECRSF
ncbi:hypothetical protein IFM89_025047 [Coptis chinensis]|uniref:Uncharacterized protein n=1 Tax=Coptis chinensis TaxID=261450 RepID=A0A835GZN8_9MAGN|nr:hypothetical protein IFM89_025047 [Coptis chinensis]